METLGTFYLLTFTSSILYEKHSKFHEGLRNPSGAGFSYLVTEFRLPTQKIRCRNEQCRVHEHWLSGVHTSLLCF